MYFCTHFNIAFFSAYAQFYWYLHTFEPTWLGPCLFASIFVIYFLCFFDDFLHYCGRLLEYSRNVPQFSFESVQITLSTSRFAPFLQWRQNHCKIQWIWHFGDVVRGLLWGIVVAGSLRLASFWQLLRLLGCAWCLHLMLISMCIFLQSFEFWCRKTLFLDQLKTVLFTMKTFIFASNKQPKSIKNRWCFGPLFETWFWRPSVLLLASFLLLTSPWWVFRFPPLFSVRACCA